MCWCLICWLSICLCLHSIIYFRLTSPVFIGPMSRSCPNTVLIDVPVLYSCLNVYLNPSYQHIIDIVIHNWYPNASLMSKHIFDVPMHHWCPKTSWMSQYIIDVPMHHWCPNVRLTKINLSNEHQCVMKHLCIFYQMYFFIYIYACTCNTNTQILIKIFYILLLYIYYMCWFIPLILIFMYNVYLTMFISCNIPSEARHIPDLYLVLILHH